jgi:hypothetical protein
MKRTWKLASTVGVAVLGVIGFLLYHAFASGTPYVSGGLLRQTIANSNGLVAWYPLDGDATDHSGNTLNATLSGFTYDGSTNGWTTGKFGKALQFNGSAYATASYNSSHAISTGLTESVWIRRTTNTGGWLISTGGAYGTTGYSLAIYSGSLYVELRGSGGGNYANLYFTLPPADSQWHLATVTWDSVSAAITGYVDGVASGTTSYVGPIGTNNDLQIGRLDPAISAGNSNPFTGSLDDVRIYNRALPPSEIRTLYMGSRPAQSNQFTKTNLAFDELSGSVASNSIGASQRGMLNNFTFDGTTNGWVTGHTGFSSSLQFNGTGSYISVGDVGPRPTAGTISYWINPSSITSYRNPLTTSDLAGGSSGNAGIRFEEDNGGNISAYMCNDGGGNCTAGPYGSLTTSSWYLVTLTWDSSSNTWNGYLNDTLKFSNTGITNWPTNFSHLAIGVGYSDTEGNRWFQGSMNGVRLYNAALSSSDVASLYAGTAPTGQDSHLYGYWPLDEGAGSIAHNAVKEGTLHNFAFSGTDGWTSGVFGNSLVFKAANSDYVSLPDQGLTQGSVEFWINPTTTGSDQRIFSQASGSGSQAGSLALNESSESGSLWIWNGSAWQRLSVAGSIPTGTWTHVVVDTNGTTATAYINGVLQQSATAGFAFNGVGVSVGGQSFGNTGNYLNAGLDDLRVSSQILSPEEIANHYRLGK